MRVSVRARDNLYILGIGHPLRRDDQVGLNLVERLAAHFCNEFHGQAIYEMELGLARLLSRYDQLLVIDAAFPQTIAPPFRLFPLAPEKSTFPGGFLTHIFDWSFLLGITEELYGKAPEAQLLAVATSDCGIGETLSSECAQNADSAFEYLVKYCSR